MPEDLEQQVGREARVREQIEIDAFFYRMWRFNSALSRRTWNAPQTGPLLIGIDPRIVIVGEDRQFDYWTGSLVAGALAMFLAGIYWMRSDRSKAEAANPGKPLPERIELPDDDSAG